VILGPRAAVSGPESRILWLQKPIKVRWQLPEAAPERLRAELAIIGA